MVGKHKTDEKFDFVGAQGDDVAGAGRGGEAAPAAGSATTQAPPIPDGIKVQSIETAGIHVDSEGHTWTIPEKDEVDVRYKSKFAIPRPDPLMSYQFVRMEDELTEMMGEQWVPVTREEIGVAVFKSEKDELGGPLDRYHVVGKQICIKKPKVLVDRQYAAQKRVCDAAVSATEPPPPGKGADIDSKTGRPTGRTMADVRNGAQRGQRRYNLGRKTETVVPKNVNNEQVSGLE